MASLLRVGMIGLGGIARRAYLPVLARRPDIELHLCTRSRETLDAIGDSYRIASRQTDLDALIGTGLDAAFVHAATYAHLGIVERLLDAGVHVYVDKPLADNAADAARLVAKAREVARSLFVGFNRRYAPVYRRLAAVRPYSVFMQKNRVGLADDTRRVVFDDFVHVVDTLRFLVPEAELVDVRAHIGDGSLRSIVVTLAAGGVAAVGVMNRDGGLTEEILEVNGPGVKVSVRDMAEVVEHRGGAATVEHRGDWTTVTLQRGFDEICAVFLDAVRRGEVIDAADALRTHEMCERIVAQVGDGAGASR